MQNNLTPQPARIGNDIIHETFQIGGMNCGGCLRNVTRILQALPVEIESVQIGHAALAYSPVAINRSQIITAITRAGFSLK